MSDVVEIDDLDLALAGLLGKYDNLASRIRVLTHDVTCSLSGVSLRVHYPAFRSGKPTDHDLADAISHYVTHFALHRALRQRVHEKCRDLSPEDRLVEYSRLRAKAIATFIKGHKLTKRNGEAGELMLFLLTEWMLGAPQILAKMSLKTEPEMAVHGSDGIHVRYDGSSKQLKVYFGEAKIHRSLSGALTSAAKSIAHALSPDEIKYEIDLVERHIDTSSLDRTARAALLSYLDPFDEKSNMRHEVITSFIAFDYAGYGKIESVPIAEREDLFIDLLQKELASISPRAVEALASAGLRDEEVELFLMPLPSVAALRENFQSQIGWKNA